VAELVDPIGSAPVASATVQPALDVRPYDDLSPVDLRVFDALPLGRPVDIASIAAVAGLDAPAVLASLGRLDLLGLAMSSGGRWRRSPRDAA
jgi:DNA processing protein